MADVLSPLQTRTLIDILTHRETYSEIEDFKQPEAIDVYGPPFQAQLQHSNSPILQSLLSKFALTLPGLSKVKADFWQTYVGDLVRELSDAELSESYDKGALGIRKTVATAISALLEYPARGIIGGVEKEEDHDSNKTYDPRDADDVARAWHDCIQEMIYGDLIDEMFDKAAKTPDLTDHTSGVQALHEYIIINLASLMHYTLILSPEGPALLRMIENVHRLLPYTIIRQTLKIGNAATMISGMMRIMLAKVSLASMTNWMGLSAGADEGMNLMQQIISQVLGWDKRELRKRADKIERDSQGPPKEVREEIKDWIGRSRAEHDECRRQSREQGMSIVTVILSLSAVSVEMNEKQHAKALEYLSLNLAVRDRQEIVKVLCQRNPDHLTAAVRDGVDAYTPMIRNIHEAVDLSDTVWDFERFVTDMLKMSKPSSSTDRARVPSVEDYVDLLHSHQSSSHKFLHQVAKNGSDMVEWWRDYIHQALAHFRVDRDPPESKATLQPSGHAAGLRQSLQQIFEGLDEQDRKEVTAELNAHQEYLDRLHTASVGRIRAVLKRSGKTAHGPGAYLARWQDLLDRTPITPNKPYGAVRYGSSQSVQDETQKDVDGVTAGFPNGSTSVKVSEKNNPRPPKSDKIWEKFGAEMKHILSGT